jgi:tetratricopeptide (TPR) repeat protein
MVNFLRILPFSCFYGYLFAIFRLNPKRINTIRDLAWLYATCIDDKYRDGEKALKLSNKAISLLKLPSNFIALAAAYAELENFKLAVLFQEKAIEIALDIGDDSSIEYYQKILKSYQSNKPWRE